MFWCCLQGNPVRQNVIYIHHLSLASEKITGLHVRDILVLRFSHNIGISCIFVCLLARRMKLLCGGLKKLWHNHFEIVGGIDGKETKQNLKFMPYYKLLLLDKQVN